MHRSSFLIIEKIPNTKLVNGKYGDLEVVIDSETHFIHIGKLCNRYGITKGNKPKKFYDYKNTHEGMQMINFINEYYSKSQETNGIHNNGIQNDQTETIDADLEEFKQVIYFNKSLPTEYRGYYACEYLIIDVARWLSPEIGFNMILLYKEYANKIKKYSLENAVKYKNKELLSINDSLYLLEEKDKKIFDLEALNKKLDERHHESMKHILNIEHQNELLLTKSDELTDDMSILSTRIVNNNIRVDEVGKEFLDNVNKLSISIPPEKSKDTHLFIIINLTNGGYYCIRRKQDTVKSELKRVGGTVLYTIETGNAFSLYDALKNSGIIYHSSNNFRIKSPYTQIDLFTFIRNKLKEIGEPIENIKNSMKYLKIDLDIEKD